MNLAALQAIKARAAVYTATPIYWPNEQFTKPVDGGGNPLPFVWSEIRGLISEIRSMEAAGSHWIRDEGFIRFHVVVPYGDGIENAWTYAELLAAVYRIANFSGVQTLAPTAPEGGEGDDDGLYFAASFSVPFWFDYQG